MSRNKKNILWGILLLLLAAGIVLYECFPSLSWLADIPLWKWLFGLFFLYLAGNRLFCAHSLAGRLDCILPLALLFLVFENEIAGIFGLKLNFAPRGTVFAYLPGGKESVVQDSVLPLGSIQF